MKVRRFLERDKDHIALLKLCRAEQLTLTDLLELERMFDAEGVPVSNGAQEITQAGGLGLFLRSLLGLDRKAAKQALTALTQGRTPTSFQKEFLDLLINHLIEQGTVDPARLYERRSPRGRLAKYHRGGQPNAAEGCCLAPPVAASSQE